MAPGINTSIAFQTAFPIELIFWHSNIRYPGSIPITAFRNYIRLNQIACSYYYNATPGSEQRDIKSALRVWAAIDTLNQVTASSSREQFARAYARITQKIQHNHPAAGPAPIASTDTQTADRNRRLLRMELDRRLEQLRS
jgi:hypothetical protein